jgi:vancomycin permeability regulator SanA
MSSLARGLALFLGALTLLNLVGTDANLWWIDLYPLPARASAIVLAALALALFAYAFLPAMRTTRRILTVSLTTVALLAAVANVVRYYVLLRRGQFSTSIPLPLSFFVVCALAVLIYAEVRPGKSHRSLIVLTFVSAAVLFPIAQIALFGMTDYRRRADVIVVFGARAYADGTPSRALADRVRTGVDLYRAGLAPALFFSGGPGEGAIDEPESMRRLARKLGVPDAAILRDPRGINTEATVRNTLAVRPRRVLAVSHFYHLPRIKMTYQRYGFSEAYTVPSRNSVPLQMPFNLVREDLAFWAYYLRRL